MQDLRDEEMMRRFLLGQSGVEEQESVEEQFITDPAYFEALCALEDELILSHVRGDLPRQWRGAFDDRVLGSTARRRRVEETELLQKALSSSRLESLRVETQKRSRWSTPIGMWMAAAAVIVGVVFSGWLIGRRAAPDRASPVASEAARLEAGPIATLVLAPGLTRSELGASNVFRVEPGIQQVRLELTAVTGNGTMRAVLRQVGGEPIIVPTQPEFRPIGDRVDVSWVIAAALLPRGDYLLTLSGETATGQPEALASRFFSIVQ